MLKRNYFISTENYDEDSKLVSKNYIVFYIKSWFPLDTAKIIREQQKEIIKSETHSREISYVHIMAFNRI